MIVKVSKRMECVANCVQSQSITSLFSGVLISSIYRPDNVDDIFYTVAMVVVTVAELSWLCYAFFANGAMRKFYFFSNKKWSNIFDLLGWGVMVLIFIPSMIPENVAILISYLALPLGAFTSVFIWIVPKRIKRVSCTADRQ